MTGSIFVLAFQGVRSHLLRSVLAVISLGIGVVGVVTMTAASSTVSAAIQQSALMRGGPRTTLEVTVKTPRFEPDLMTAAELDLHSQMPSAKFSRGGSMPGLTALVKGEISPAEVSFTDSDLQAIRPFVVLDGHWVDDAPRMVPLSMVNRAAERVGMSLGSTVTLSGDDRSPLEVMVEGVVDDGSDTPQIYVSLGGAQEWISIRTADFGERLTVSGRDVDPEDVRARLNELSSLMQIPASWTVRQTDTIGKLADPLKATRSSFTIVGGLGLLTAIVAIVNLGLSTVRERSAELSIRRALGAHRLDVALIMMVESGIIGLLAGSFAIPSSLLLYSAIGNAFNAPLGIDLPPYPLEYALAGFAVGVGASLVAGLIPALRSATIPISTFSRE